MNGFLLLIPFFLIRFGIMFMLNKGAIRRAAHFPPMAGNEMLTYWVYQFSNVAIFAWIFFGAIKVAFSWPFYIGLGFYLVGLILCAVSVLNFAAPSSEGFNCNGLYRYSRNPMYVSYFIFFVGCALLTQSLVLCGMVLIFQLSAHWIIIAEERWCVETFGKEYRQYMKEVRRYV